MRPRNAFFNAVSFFFSLFEPAVTVAAAAALSSFACMSPQEAIVTEAWD